MTKFEQFLIEKGYRKYILTHPEKKYQLEKEGRHIISTMSNLCYSYFHENDLLALSKIEAGISILDEDNFTKEDMIGEIVFGISELHKPPTLISPRPVIHVYRMKNGKVQVFRENDDDCMSIVLDKIPHDIILKAMYNRNIVFSFNETGMEF